MSELGNLLRKLRGKESLRDAGKRAGISHNYLRIIEKGIDPRSGSPVKATPDTLRALSKAYNYKYDDLMKVAGYLDDNGEPDTSDIFLFDIDDFELTDEQIISKYNLKVDGVSLTTDQVKIFINFIRAGRMS